MLWFLSDTGDNNNKEYSDVNDDIKGEVARVDDKVVAVVTVECW